MKIATLVAKTLVALAAIAILGGIILFVLAVHVMTWPYRSTHGRGRSKGQIEALLALGTSLAAAIAAFSARADAKTARADAQEARIQADRDEQAWEEEKQGRKGDRRRDTILRRRDRLGYSTIQEQARAGREADQGDDVPF